MSSRRDATIIGKVDGSLSSTQLAEAALATMKKGHAYAVGINLGGQLLVTGRDSLPASQIVMVCTRCSDPDILADNIHAELRERGAYKPRRGGRRRKQE